MSLYFPSYLFIRYKQHDMMSVFYRKCFYLPVQVRLVFVYIYVVERIHAKPCVESKPILVGPFCYGWHCYCLLRKNNQYQYMFNFTMYLHVKSVLP